MFKYLISPKNPGDPSHLIAITVKNDTITAYVQNKPGFFGDNAPEREYKKFFQCIKTSTSDSGNVTFIKQNNILHSDYHSINDPHESNLRHSHVKHQNQIQRENLKVFLKNLQRCEGLEGYLNHALIKDIIQKYKEYCFEYRFMNSYRNDDYIVSNNPHYSVNISIPQLSEHARCLLLPDKIGCDPSTPAMIAREESLNMISQASQLLLPPLLATGLLLFCLHREKRNEPKKLKNSLPILIKKEHKLKAY